MANIEKMYKLYDEVIENNELTTKTLKSIGFNSNNIKKLIEESIIERIKRGKYSFIDFNGLYAYGKNLLKLKEYKKAILCFYKCNEMNPDHINTIQRLLINAIYNKNYDEAFIYLDKLFSTDNKFYVSEANMYLHILSLITDVPDKNKEYAKYIKLDDIRVDIHDKRYNDVYAYNKIRISILNKKFAFALKQLNEIIAKKGSETAQDCLTKILLKQIIEQEKKHRITLSDLIKEKKYEDIITLLENKELKHKLSTVESYIIKLAKILLNIKNNNVEYQIRTYTATTVYDAIDGYNFKLALELCSIYNEIANLKENLLELLLFDICELNNNKSTEERTIEKIKEDDVQQNNSLETYNEIINVLMKSDIDNAIKMLKKYLNEIGKEKYEHLIVNLIKLSILENDLSYDKPLKFLNNLINENCEINISDYIEAFYLELKENNFDIARIYIEIMRCCYKICGFKFEVTGLYNIVDNLEKLNENITSKEENDEIENSTQTEETIDRTEKVEKEEIKDTVKYTEEEFIESKHKILLENGGILLLKPMDKTRRKQIHNIVYKYPDMTSFSIGEGDNRRIVLRYKSSVPFSIKDILEAAIRAYTNKNYELCIEYNLKLLQVSSPKTFIYAKLGLCYMKIGKKDLAIDYLTVANELYKLTNSSYDYSELILSLKGYIDKEDRKKVPKVKDNEFENVDNNYGIDNIDEIFEHIYKSGLNVESACLELGLTLEQVDIIRLIYARLCFAKGYYDKGNEFIKTVEKSKNKTDLTKKIFNEIIKNKKFYINRQDELDINVSLILKP